MNHLTVSVDTSQDVTALILVGPPASGKTTIRSVLSDFDVVGCDLSPYQMGGEVIADWHEAVSEVIESAVQQQPQICCIEGAITDQQVNWVREATGESLVIRVRASDRAERLDRYVSRELSYRDSDSSVLSGDTLAEVRTSALRREELEQPYPQHDLLIENDDDLRASELSQRCANIVGVVSETTPESCRTLMATE